jgi:hypothetical protein
MKQEGLSGVGNGRTEHRRGYDRSSCSRCQLTQRSSTGQQAGGIMGRATDIKSPLKAMWNRWATQKPTTVEVSKDIFIYTLNLYECYIHVRNATKKWELKKARGSASCAWVSAVEYCVWHFQHQRIKKKNGTKVTVTKVVLREVLANLSTFTFLKSCLEKVGDLARKMSWLDRAGLLPIYPLNHIYSTGCFSLCCSSLDTSIKWDLLLLQLLVSCWKRLSYYKLNIQ